MATWFERWTPRIVMLGLLATLAYACEPAQPQRITEASRSRLRVAGGAAWPNTLAVHVDRRLEIDGPGWFFSLEAVAWGRRGDVNALAEPRARRKGSGVELVRPGLVEWYRPHPRGLEHGFTLAARPAGTGTVEMKLSCRGLSPSPSAEGAVLHDDEGVRLGYEELVAYDSAGALLPATLVVAENHIVIAVDDASAQYPIVIDPILFAPQPALNAPDVAAADDFGEALAISGDLLVIADPNAYAPSPNVGIVSAYERQNGVWAHVAQLQHPTPDINQFMGRSVAVHGDTVVAGVPQATAGALTNVGEAVVFERDGAQWSVEDVLTPPAAISSHFFGIAVDIDGDRIVVGADGGNSISNVGAAYVFHRDSGVWSLEAELVAPDVGTGDQFGTTVAISGDTVAVGSPRHDGVEGSNIGAVNIFDRVAGSWMHSHELLSPVPSANDTFGGTLALDGDLLWVRETDTGPSASDVIHAFRRNAGVWQPEPVESPGFSGLNTAITRHITLSGQRAAFGSLSQGVSGRAFIYRHEATGWVLEQTLDEPAAIPNNLFGFALALDGGTLAVGAIDAGPGFVGRVYPYVLVGKSCVDGATCTNGLCVHGFCCDAACDEGCGRCDVPGSEGVCTPLGNGTPAEDPCLGYLCESDVSCPAPCSDTCAPGYYCNDGVCEEEIIIGQPCDSPTACGESAYCVDGVCCSTPCADPCVACAEPGSVGTCVLITGQPRPGHPACPAPACDAGIAASYACEGNLGCTLTETACEPYACDDDSCHTSCIADSQCAPQYDCDMEVSSCISLDPVCDGDVVTQPNVPDVSCRPYRCTQLGDCLTSCISTGDCSPGFVCSSAGRCVEPPQPASDTGGCRISRDGSGDATAGRFANRDWTWLVGLLLLGVRRSRLSGRRRGSCGWRRPRPRRPCRRRRSGAGS